MTTITIQKSELANAASVVQPFFTKKTPPFSCIQMRLKDNRLEMFASLGEGGSAYVAIPASFKCKDMPRWQMLDGQALVDVLALRAATSLDLTFSEISLVIKESGSCATLKLIQSAGLAEDAFPKGDAALTLDGLSFAHAVRVGEAASDDIARAALTGLYIHTDPEKRRDHFGGRRRFHPERCHASRQDAQRKRRPGLQNVDLGMAHRQDSFERHDQSAVCEIWIAAIGKRRTSDTDRERWLAAADCFKGGSAGPQARPAKTAITL